MAVRRPGVKGSVSAWRAVTPNNSIASSWREREGRGEEVGRGREGEGEGEKEREKEKKIGMLDNTLSAQTKSILPHNAGSTCA